MRKVDTSHLVIGDFVDAELVSEIGAAADLDRFPR